MTSLTPVCRFERLDPEDVLSAIRSNSTRLYRQFVRVAALGLGHERFLQWSVQDIGSASASTDEDQTMRFSVSALMNARRSLSCLADQYIRRDCFDLCQDAPHGANSQARLLVRRGVFDPLASEALQRAVKRRDRVEHQYEGLGLEDAQDTVHLIRSTIENCVTKSDPYLAPAFFGIFLGGHGFAGVETHWFNGWSGPLFVFARYESPPWFGVVIPSSETTATVRKVAFSELTCNALLEALLALEGQALNGYSMYGESTFKGQLECLGLR